MSNYPDAYTITVDLTSGDWEIELPHNADGFDLEALKPLVKSAEALRPSFVAAP